MKKLSLALAAYMVFSIFYTTHAYAQITIAKQKQDLKKIEAKLNVLQADQQETLKKAKEQADFANLKSGIASYYDYTLKDGWSSVGHKVCASRDFPRGSTLRVRNGARMVDCLVTDYGPDAKVHPDRIIDLSSTAFTAISPKGRSVGLLNVQVWRIK